jgi:hypothetical protein
MGKPVAVKPFNELSAVTTVTVPLAPHVTGNTIGVFIVRDQNASDFSIPAGWNQQDTDGIGTTGNNTVRGAVYLRTAASSSETDPTFTFTTADEVSAVAFTLDGIHVTAVDVFAKVQRLTGTPYASTTVTTNFDNALVMHFCASDGGVSPTAYPGNMNISNQDSGACGAGVAWRFQKTAGVSEVCNFYCAGSSDESIIFTIAFRDGSSGTIIPGYIDPNFGTLLHPLKGTNTPFTSDAVDTNAAAVSNWGSPVNPQYCYQVDASPLTLTNVTTAATNATTADVVPIPATEAVGDYFAVGNSATFGAVRIDNNGGTAGTVGVNILEYWNGSAWASLQKANGIDAFTAAAGTGHVKGWVIPSDWTAGTPDGLPSAYWMRFRVTTVYTVNPTFTQVWISQIGCYYDALAASGDSAYNPFEDAINITPASLANCFAGAAYTFGSTKDCDDGLLIGNLKLTSPRDKIDSGPKSRGGIPLALGDASNNWKLWTICSADSLDFDRNGSNTYCVKADESVDSKYYQSTTPPTLSATKKIGIVANNYDGACQVQFSQFIKITGYVTIQGGSSANPLSWADVISICNSYPVPLLKGEDNKCCVPLKFGGIDPLFLVNDDPKSGSITFPTQALSGNLYTLFHCDTAYVGVIVDARSGDVFKPKAGVWSGGSIWRFEMLATCSASATYDFAGRTIINATVTLRAVTTFLTMTFINCLSFTQNTAVLTSCSFKNCKITCDDPSKISLSTFTSGGTGHALELTTPGTYTFTTNTFSGYGANATTDACIYNNSGGLVTINLGAYGDQVPTVRNGAGASTVVNNKANVGTITGIVANSRLQIYNDSTATEIVNAVNATSTFSANYTEGVEFTSGNLIRIRLTYCVGLVAYLEYVVTVVAGPTGWSALASQEIDSVYASNAIDGSTVTEFSADVPNIEIDTTDGDGTTSWQRVYAWYVFALTSSLGISAVFGGIVASDAVNYTVNGSVVDLAFDNKNAALLTINGGFGNKVGGARGLVSATTTGAIYFDSGRAYLADSAAIKAKTDLIPSAPAAVGSAMTLTTGERDAVAAALLDLTNGIETGYTLRQAMRIAAAVLGGKVSGGPDTPIFRNLGDTQNRVAAVADKDGNRTAVTLTP